MKLTIKEISKGVAYQILEKWISPTAKNEAVWEAAGTRIESAKNCYSITGKNTQILADNTIIGPWGFGFLEDYLTEAEIQQIVTKEGAK